MPLRLLLVPLVILVLAASAAIAGSVDPPPRAEIRLDNAAESTQLAQRLPRSILFTDAMGTAHVARLREPLDFRGGAPISGYRAGDVAYWAAEQSIIVFASDGAGVPEDGLVLIGHVSAGLDDLAGCNRDCLVLFDVAAHGADDGRRPSGESGGRGEESLRVGDTHR